MRGKTYSLYVISLVIIYSISMAGLYLGEKYNYNLEAIIYIELIFSYLCLGAICYGYRNIRKDKKLLKINKKIEEIYREKQNRYLNMYLIYMIMPIFWKMNYL